MDITTFALLLLGFVSGTINSVLGLGWGVINVPMLMLLPGFDIRRAVALSVVTAVFMIVTATYENARYGLVQWNYVIIMGIGGAGGGALGAYLLRSIPTLTLQRIVGALVIAFGAKMMFAR